jgi:putative phosphoesterase
MLGDQAFIGLISDTHGLMRPEAAQALAGAQHIVHAGDIGDPSVIERLAALAPLTVVRGNNDSGPWARALHQTERVEIGRRRILVIHELAKLSRHDVGLADVVVVGHSHRPFVSAGPGYLLVNPGSAGPRRFKLPVTVGRLTASGEARVEIIEIVR